MRSSRVEEWKLRRASDLLQVLNKMTGRVSGRVFVRRKSIWARWVNCIKVKGGTPVFQVCEQGCMIAICMQGTRQRGVEASLKFLNISSTLDIAQILKAME